MSDSAQMERAATLRKFNPGAMQSDQDLIAQFAVRHKQFEQVMETLRENLQGASNQHLLVVAPRGRGKTMLLARVGAEVRQDDELAEQLLPVRFMEESMEVLGIADFWLECLLHLANALNPTEPERAAGLKQTHAELASIMDNKTLEQRARAAVLSTADEIDRRLVLMVENLQDLSQDADKDFGWQLRKTLQTEPRIILLASATSQFTALEEADQPFFELFREIHLPALDTEECRQLWVAATSQEVTAREIRPLEILTGGSPRLLIFIASFARHHSMRQLMEELVTLIDDHTEYFRGHLDALPKVERRVYVAVIDLWRPSTAREIAERARMDIRKVSSLLGRLVTRGAVVRDDSDPKMKLYSASERLYSIYYKLRRERNEAAVVQGLIQFMAAFYTGPDWERVLSKLLAECREQPSIEAGFQIVFQEDAETRLKIAGSMTFSDFRDKTEGAGSAIEWLLGRVFCLLPVLEAEQGDEFMAGIEAIMIEAGRQNFLSPNELSAIKTFVQKFSAAVSNKSAGFVHTYLDQFLGLMTKLVVEPIGSWIRTRLDGKRETLQSADLLDLILEFYGHFCALNPQRNRVLWIKVLYVATFSLIAMGVPSNRLLLAIEAGATPPVGLETLVVALNLEAGRSVRASAEVLHVARDIQREFRRLKVASPFQGALELRRPGDSTDVPDSRDAGGPKPA